MYRQSPSKNRPEHMLAVWEELEKIKAEAAQAEQQATALPKPVVAGPGSVPSLRSKQPPGTDSTPCSVLLNLVGKSAVSQQSSASPALMTPTPVTDRQPPSSQIFPVCLSGSDINLPDLPDGEHEDPMRPQNTVSTSAAPTSGIGPRRRSFIAEEWREQVREFRRRVSRKLSKLAENVSDWVQKASPRSGRNSPERSSPTGRSSPVNGSPRKTETLSDQDRLRHAAIDTQIDLSDPQFLQFVNSAAEAAFIKPWTHDTADTRDSDGQRKSVTKQLQPSFIRDFGNSDYRVRNADGSVTPFADTDEFVQWIGAGKGCDLPRVVSNIASQNLGNFLKNSLFLRQDENKVSQSVLRLHDGTPVMPLAIVKASYVFGKDDDGDITLDYCWESSGELNRGNPLRVKRMAGDYSQTPIADQATASLRITTRITISRDGEWYLGNPRVQAKGWHLPAQQ